MQKNCVFYAKISKGYIPKVTFDAMATNLQHIPIKLSKKGMFIRVADREEVVSARSMWDIFWERKKFSEYSCTKTKTMSINVKHMQKMLKNVKKKDSLTFYITKTEPNKLQLLIQPSGVQNHGASARAETVFLSIKQVNVVVPDLPDKYVNENGDTENAYGNPMVIESANFQKIKKMTSVCKTTIKVKIQRNNYISFCVGDDSIMGSHLEFGELTHTPEEDYQSEGTNDTDEEGSSKSDEESSAEPEESLNSSENSDEDEEESGENEYPYIYEKDFDVSLFTPLVKLPGLCTYMEFYAPKVVNFPLKVNMTTTSGLGDVTIYLKDREYIEMVEEQLKKSKK
jgi:hypothetical protein